MVFINEAPVEKYVCTNSQYQTNPNIGCGGSNVLNQRMIEIVFQLAEIYQYITGLTALIF